MPLITGRVGRASGATGEVEARLDQFKNLIVADGAAKYQDAVLGGNVYGVAQQTGTTTQAGLSATTPALTLYNPASSGVNGSVWFAGCLLQVVNAAAAAVWIGANTSTVAAAVTGTLTTAHRNMLLGQAQGNKLQALLAATLPAAPVALCSLASGLTGAITTIPGIATFGRWFDGSLILAPGTAISFQTSTASGTSSFLGEFIWQEIPV